MLSRDRICWPTRFGKADLNLIFSKSSLQNMRGFHRVTILSPSFHGLRKERLAHWPPFCVLNTTKNSRGVTSRKIGWGCAARFLKPSPYFRPKSEIFPTLFQTWSKIWYPTSDLKPWSPTCDRSAWQAVMACNTVVCVDIKGEMVLSPNDEEVAYSSRKHTQFKTRVHKPYPMSYQNG